MIELSTVGLVLYELLVVAAIVHVLMDNRQPDRTIAWALIIFFVPFAGIIFYLFFGVNTRKERLISKRSMDKLTKSSMLSFVEQRNLKVDKRHRQLVDLYVNQDLSLPFKDNKTDIFTSGEAFFQSLINDISHAQHHIHIDMYIWEDDTIGNKVADALIARAKEGVAVRVVYDDVGCWRVPQRFFNRMSREGISVQPFMPVRFPTLTRRVNYRNHRKVIVIDGQVGYIGGMNIADRYVHGIGDQEWRDTMLRIVGGAVYGLQRTFLIDWYFVSRTLITDSDYYPPVKLQQPNDCVAQVVTSSPAADFPNIMQGYVRIIMEAKNYVYIQTPYFMPNEPVLFALKTAALGGVDVRIMVPERCDAFFVEWASRSYLREVVEAGVKVYLYRAGFLHSKTLICDDSIVACGSTNVDFRSFENNFEANIFIYNEVEALRHKNIFLDDQRHSISLRRIKKRMRPPFLIHFWESVVRLFSPLM
jgi:cardiolipin synthase